MSEDETNFGTPELPCCLKCATPELESGEHISPDIQDEDDS
jgi:hypothetical protein